MNTNTIRSAVIGLLVGMLVAAGAMIPFECANAGGEKLTIYAGPLIPLSDNGVPACASQVYVDRDGTGSRKITDVHKPNGMGGNIGVRLDLYRTPDFAVVGLYDHRSCLTGEDSIVGTSDLLGVHVEWTFDLNW